jgi:hypothetical protein
MKREWLQVFILREEEGLSEQVTAELLGIPLSTALRRIRIADVGFHIVALVRYGFLSTLQPLSIPPRATHESRRLLSIA